MLINTTHLTLSGRLLQERRAAYKATVLLMLFVAFFPPYVGCGGKGGNDHKVSHGTTMSADKKLDDDKTRPLRWTFGASTDGDAARSTVFRAPPRALGSGSPSQPKIVVSRPMPLRDDSPALTWLSLAELLRSRARLRFTKQ